MANIDLAGIYASGYMKSKDIEVLKSIDFDSFLNKTALPFGLLGCRKRSIIFEILKVASMKRDLKIVKKI